MEKLLLSLSLLSEDSTSDCVVESESSELSSKRKSMLEASMYYMQFCFCTMSVFLFTLDFEKFFTLIFSSTKCVKWLFSTFQPTYFEKVQDINLAHFFEKTTRVKKILRWSNLNISKAVERFVTKLFFDIVIKILEFDVVYLLFIIFRLTFSFER